MERFNFDRRLTLMRLTWQNRTRLGKTSQNLADAAVGDEELARNVTRAVTAEGQLQNSKPDVERQRLAVREAAAQLIDAVLLERTRRGRRLIRIHREQIVLIVLIVLIVRLDVVSDLWTMVSVCGATSP